MRRDGEAIEDLIEKWVKLKGESSLTEFLSMNGKVGFCEDKNGGNGEDRDTSGQNSESESMHINILPCRCQNGFAVYLTHYDRLRLWNTY